MRHGLRPHHTALISLAMLAIPALDADVTLRYKTEVSFNPALPPQMAQAMPGMEAALPKESSVQLKNGKGHSSSGANVSICDFSKQEMTLLDNEGKRYATLPFAQFADAFAGAMPEMPSQPAGMMASMKPHFESKATGRTETIQGIEGEEHEFAMTVDAPAMPNMPSGGPMMRMVMHFWRARRSEVMRVPAVREVAGYNLFAAATMNPVSSMEKIFRQMPGFADNFAAVYKEMQSGGTPLILRMHIDLFLPAMSALLKQTPGNGGTNGGLNPDAPFLEIRQELAELSTAAIPDTVFQIPEGYKPVPAAEILSDMMAKAQAAYKKQ